MSITQPFFDWLKSTFFYFCISFLLFLNNNTNEITKNITDKICEILNSKNIKLSSLIDSINILINEYYKIYTYKIWPLNFLFFCRILKNIKIIKVLKASYKKVGWTSKYLPYAL